MGLESAGGLTAAYDKLHENPEITGEGIELALEFECRALEAGADPNWTRERLRRFEIGKKAASRPSPTTDAPTIRLWRGPGGERPRQPPCPPSGRL